MLSIGNENIVMGHMQHYICNWNGKKICCCLFINALCLHLATAQQCFVGNLALE